jgi:Tol biopolymer transport system component
MPHVRPALKIAISAAILIIFAGLHQHATADNDMTPLQGPYLGQQAPGNTPELFAPGFISRPDYFEHSGAVFSPDLREVYWSAKPNAERYYGIYYMEMTEDRWTAPSAIEFLEHNYRERGPVFSPDGRTLYFDYNGDIWMVERKTDSWSEPEPVAEISDSVENDRVCSVSKDGSVYFIRCGSERSDRTLFVSRMIDGNLSAPVRSTKDIPTGYHAVGDVYVAPDETYAILELHADERTSELFISYRMNDGTWTSEIKLPLGWARCPVVSPDGKYIFFMRREGIYWADAKVIGELRPPDAEESTR